MNAYGLRGWLVLIIVGTIASAVIGAVAVGARPPAYTSTASTSVSADSDAADPGALQGVTASIFMMMPVYAEQARSDAIVEAAAQASGLPPEEIAEGLSIERTIDSSVLQWSLTAEDAQQASTALNAAVDEFRTYLPQVGPKTSEGEPLLMVWTPAPASEATAGPMTALVGGGAGGLIGLLGSAAAMLLFYRGRNESVSDWDEVERMLGIPVVAELTGEEARRLRQWRYVGDRMAAGSGDGTVGLFGASRSASDADANDLRAAIRRAGLLSPAVISSGTLLDGQTGDTSALDGAVVLVDPASDLMRQVASDCRALARSVPGPVVGVLDRRRPRG